jgi:hyperosmotically inducible protein
MKRWLWLVPVLLLLGSNRAAAADPDGNQMRDSRILYEVIGTVNDYVHFTIFDDLNAHVRDGEVTLTGKVTMPFKRNEIRKRVARIDGVKNVRNEVEVLPVSPFDDQLRVRIARAIYGNSNFWNYAALRKPPIHIVVERGRVTLTGVVHSEVDRAMARALASQSGAFSVTSQLRTDSEVRAEHDRAQ